MQPLPRTFRCIDVGLDMGLHVGAQIYVSFDGLPITDSAFGIARAGVPMTPDTLMLWQSSTKPVAGVAIAQLWEKDLLQLDDRVSRFIPAFASRGKEAITIRHLLNHTCGIRGALLGWSAEPWDALVSRICDSRIETGWLPGKRAGYHLGSSWIILGEIIRVIDGRPFEQYVRDEIFLPTDMKDSWVGMPTDHYLAYGDRIGLMHDTTISPPAANFPNDTLEGSALCRPGANGRGPARELGRFYEALLAGLQSKPSILRPQTIEAMTGRSRVGMYDQTFKQVLDWGMGFMVDNNRYGAERMPYPFSKYCSPRTFGHGGSQSSVGFADPEFGLACAIIFNGCPGEIEHHLRIRETLAALYEDLELDGSIPNICS